jgi:hypothetical protein
MENYLIYVYNICWPSTDKHAFYNCKNIPTHSYVKIPKDTFSNDTERNVFIDFILLNNTGIKPLTYTYSLEYVCHL